MVRSHTHSLQRPSDALCIFALYDNAAGGRLGEVVFCCCCSCLYCFDSDSVTVITTLSSPDLHPAGYCVRRGWCWPMSVPLGMWFSAMSLKAMLCLDSCPVLTPVYAILKGSCLLAIQSKHQKLNFFLIVSTVMFLAPQDPLVRTGIKIVEILFVFILNDEFKTSNLFIFYNVIQYYIYLINIHILRV